MKNFRQSCRLLSRFIFVAALLSACNARKDKLGIDDTTTPILTASEISFPLVKQHVFAKSCNSCHSAPLNKGNVNLETYEAAVGFGPQIKSDVDSGRMPQSPVAALSQRQKDIVDLWVAQGMPNAAGSPPAPPRPPLEPKFASIKEGIFKFKCATCHNPTGKAKNLKLDHASDLLVGQNILVVPGKPEASKLVRVVSPGARHPMPPKDSDKEPLTPEQVTQLSSWVLDGALDDSQDENSRFMAIQKGIIQDKCISCHKKGEKAEDVPLDTVRDLVGGGPPFVYPKQPEISKLLEITAPGAKEPMPPADSNVAPLTQEEWNIIKEWIENGANQ